MRTYQLRFVLAGPSGFTRLSLVFLLRAVQECGASFSFLLSSRSNATGEREIGVGTVTAPFSHAGRPTARCVIFSHRATISRAMRKDRRAGLRRETTGCRGFFSMGVSDPYSRSFSRTFFFKNWLITASNVSTWRNLLTARFIFLSTTNLSIFMSISSLRGNN